MRYGWKPYVPVGQRRKSAEQAMGRLRKSGVSLQPVRIEGRLIARTFWGKAWCDHLESYSDFENRLPRGRTYVRNGSVCHLEILRGRVNAKVQGSSMYTVAVDISPLPGPSWKAIKKRCTGRISSLLDLLQGRLSAGVMEVVTDRDAGLFPSPREIRMQCSCPDWATMCKHVAAVLYGVGARLDAQPELLFPVARCRPRRADRCARGGCRAGSGERRQGQAHRGEGPGRDIRPGRGYRRDAAAETRRKGAPRESCAAGEEQSEGHACEAGEEAANKTPTAGPEIGPEN